jgi:hypothetical protein
MASMVIGALGAAGSALAGLPASDAESTPSDAVAGALSRVAALEEANRALDARLTRLTTELEQEKARALQAVEHHVHEYEKQPGGFMRLVDIERSCSDCLIKVVSPDDQRRGLLIDTTSGPIF